MARRAKRLAAAAMSSSQILNRSGRRGGHRYGQGRS